MATETPDAEPSPGGPDAAAFSERVAARLTAALAGRYELGREIGRGGSAVVFAARDLKQGRDVAIKVLHPELTLVAGAGRFLREIRLAATLSHPNIMALFDSGEAEGLLYYVMPKVEGESLRRRLVREQQLPLDVALRITHDVAAALLYAHAHGILHRDVKPENILLVGDAAVLCDFGLALPLQDVPGDRVTGAGLAVGTAAYMSPEQSIGAAVDGRSDQYALACVLYEMLAGDPPFTGRTTPAILARHRMDPAPRLAAVRASVPRPLDDVIQSALAKLPADRYPTMRDFISALEGALTTETRTVAFGARRLLGARLGKRLLWISGLVVALGIGYTVWSRSRNGKQDLDPNRVVVAPFELVGARDTVWRYGLVDYLLRNFDGAGPLRAVPASVAIAAWKGRSDPASAEALGRSTGAALVVFGQLLSVRSDSVRLRASVLDLRERRIVSEIDLTGDARDVPQLADSLTVRAIRSLSQNRVIGAIRQASIGSTSLLALKEFLQGEQLLRVNDYEAARARYEAAASLDSSFALAFHRMRSVYRALNSETDSISFSYALHAGRLNRGLAPRDSLLLVADSLAASLPNTNLLYDPPAYARLRRRFQALDLVVRGYPNDPEAWEELAEARHHFGSRVGVSSDLALEAFERAIRLDPQYAPPYFHAIELSFGLRGGDSAARLLDVYLKRTPRAGIHRPLARMLADYRRTGRMEAIPLQDYSAEELMRAAYLVRRWPEPPRLAELLYRQVLRRNQPEFAAQHGEASAWLAVELLWQGRVRAALGFLDDAAYHEAPLEALFVAETGAITADSVTRMLDRWLHDDDWAALLASVTWWGEHGDAARLTLAQARFDSLARMATRPRERETARYGAAAARMYRSLARGESGAALAEAVALPDSLCGWLCLPVQLTTSRLLARSGSPARAARLLDTHPPSAAPFTIAEVLWHRERARVALLSGDSTAVRVSLAFLDAVWARADPALRASLDSLHLRPAEMRP